MNKRDIALAAGLLGVVLLAWLLLPRLFSGGEEITPVQVEVRRGGTLVLQAPLSEQATYALVEGAQENQLRVEEGKVYMLSANCPDQWCVRQGAIESASGSIICLPHRLVVRLTGGEPDLDEPDVIAR